MQSVSQSGLRVVLAILMLLTPFHQQLRAAAQNSQPEKKLSRAEARAKVAGLYQFIERNQKQIPRETFDPEVIVAECERRPERIFEWVRDQTYLVPYRGLLRGYRGTLMDRMGNTLDRSLLLAELLTLSGKQVRLASAKLTEAQVKQLDEARRPFPLEGVSEKQPLRSDQILQTLEQLGSAVGINSRDLQTQVQAANLQREQLAETTIQRVFEQTPLLATLINDVIDPQETAVIRTQQRAALQEHWWVQYQDDGKWVDCDTSRPDTQIGTAVATADRFVEVSDEAPRLEDAIAEESKHTIEVRILIERWDRGKLIEAPVLTHTLEPHQLSGEPILITHVPLDWPLDLKWLDKKAPLESLKRQVANQWEWFPILLVGQKLLAESSYTTSGRINENAYAKLQQAPINEGFGKLTEALKSDVVDQLRSERGERPQQDALTAEWIEYVISRPGAEPQTIRRPVFDLIGPAARQQVGANAPQPDFTELQKLQRGVSVLGIMELLPICCQFSHDYVKHLSANRFLANRESVLNSLQPDTNTGPYRVLPQPGRVYEFALSRHEWNPHRHEAYLDRLNLISYHNMLLLDQEGNLRGARGFDILKNEVALHAHAEIEPFHFHLEQGVLDTVLESVLLGLENEVANTSVLFEQTGASPDRWQTVSDAADAKFAAMELSSTTRARIEADLSDGYIVVIHDSGNRDEATGVGWWRVDPHTGQTLGMMGSARGEGHVEYLIITGMIMVCALVAFFSFIDSFKMFASDLRICSEDPDRQPHGGIVADAPDLDGNPPPRPDSADPVDENWRFVGDFLKTMLLSPLFREYMGW